MASPPITPERRQRFGEVTQERRIGNGGGRVVLESDPAANAITGNETARVISSNDAGCRVPNERAAGDRETPTPIKMPPPSAGPSKPMAWLL